MLDHAAGEAVERTEVYEQGLDREQSARKLVRGGVVVVEMQRILTRLAGLL